MLMQRVLVRLLSVLLAMASAALAEVTFQTEQLNPADPAWSFKAIPRPSKSDIAAGAKGTKAGNQFEPADSSASTSSPYAVPPAFFPLRFGAVKPRGWILEQMRRDLRDGFAGHLDELCHEASSDIFASGQSNMQWPIDHCRKEDQAMAASGPVPLLRIFQVPEGEAYDRKETLDGVIRLWENIPGEGNKHIDKGLVISFEHTGGGLASRDGKPLNWFEIAGSDGLYQPAEATISADGTSLLLTSPKVAKPDRARFAWSPIAEPNLMNREGLPAAAFNTHWPKNLRPGEKP